METAADAAAVSVTVAGDRRAHRAEADITAGHKVAKAARVEADTPTHREAIKETDPHTLRKRNSHRGKEEATDVIPKKSKVPQTA